MDEIIRLDQQLLLFFNEWHNEFADSFMVTATKTGAWALFFVAILAVLYRACRRSDTRATLKHLGILILMVALVVLIADRFSSGICKPLFARPRPSHEPLLEGMVHLVGGSKGSMYGFISSHAANTFGVAMFLSLLLRHRYVVATTFFWAAICSYTRIYLGKHYPGDILCGAIAGLVVGYLIYRLYRWVAKRQSLAMRHVPNSWRRAVPISFFASIVIFLIMALF